MMEISLQAPSLGWIPRRDDLVVPSRHLGLAMAHESGVFGESAKVMEEYCSIDAIIQAAAGAVPLVASIPDPEMPARVSIGIAYDEAFCFYYRDNFDRLAAAGANLVFFSPLHDRLPAVDALYYGGGYPELHLPLLESSACTRDLKQKVEDGMPVYAECGGLMYLSQEIRADKTYRMAGVLPAVAAMTDRIQALGYVKGTSVGGGAFLPPSQEITGHEFHYSRLYPAGDARYALSLSRGKGIDAGRDGLVVHNALGCYTHAYFSRAFADSFVHAAERFMKDT